MGQGVVEWGGVEWGGVRRGGVDWGHVAQRHCEDCLQSRGQHDAWLGCSGEWLHHGNQCDALGGSRGPSPLKLLPTSLGANFCSRSRGWQWPNLTPTKIDRGHRCKTEKCLFGLTPPSPVFCRDVFGLAGAGNRWVSPLEPNPGPIPRKAHTDNGTNCSSSSRKERCIGNSPGQIAKFM